MGYCGIVVGLAAGSLPSYPNGFSLCRRGDRCATGSSPDPTLFAGQLCSFG
jgi:hypothetical protein